MYAWRAHIGLLAPGSGPNMEMDFHRFLPQGVAVATSRLPFSIPTPQGLLDMVGHLERACEVYARYKHDVILFGCTSGSLIGGPGFDRELMARMETITGDPCLTTSTAVLEAFQALGVSRPLVITPYPDDTNQAEKTFLESHGVHVTSISGLGNDYVNQSITDIEPHMVFQKLKALPREDADCLFISCTGLNVLDLIPLLERDWGLPVVTSNQASLWACLRRAGVGDTLPTLGRLLNL